MAEGSTISMTLTLDGDEKSFKDLAKTAAGLKKVFTSMMTEAQQLNGRTINFAALATGIDATQRSFSQLQSSMKDLADAYAVQEVAETKLATVMQQRMGASDAEIQSIKDLASAQQEIGVIGDEVQLSGAQQIATFLREKASLETLLPAMNNLLAQQKGLTASTGDAVQVGNLMGKAMMGQVDALKRVGISFTEAEANVLKYGTEQEKAAMLAQVIQNNVGNMNAELAKTESGRQQQLANTLGDIKEQIGGLVNGALPFVTITAQSTQALAGITTLIGGVKTLTITLYHSTKAFLASAVAMAKNRGAALATAAAQKIAAAATVIWTTAQKVLNWVLSANPIGLVIVAVGALVSAVAYAYNKFAGFREIVNKVWRVIIPFGKVLLYNLVRPLKWVAEKCIEVWKWLAKLIGLSGKKVDVSVEVSKQVTPSEGGLGTPRDYQPTTPSKPKSKAPIDQANLPLNEKAVTLKEISHNIDILTAQLQNATIEEAAQINQQIKAWEDKADAIRNAGKETQKSVEQANLPLNEEASTLKQIGDNIDILTAQLQNATIEEAAQINRQIKAWEDKADAIRNAGRETEKLVDKADLPLDERASTLKQIGDNIDILTAQLQNATIEEAAQINQQIKAWEDKADAIRNAGKEAEKTAISTGKALADGWAGIKEIGSGIDGITNSLSGNGNAWQTVVGFVDGFLGLYQGLQSVIGVVGLLTSASASHAAIKGVEATAESTAATARTAAAATTAAAGITTVATNKLVAASFKELAAAEYMAAHAYIPFAGFGIASGFTASMLAAVSAAGSVPALAEGGVASGPTLALVGEYAGAKSNPEVIAPLDKLRGMLAAPAGVTDFSKVQFEIKGRTLVGILAKENNLIKRS